MKCYIAGQYDPLQADSSSTHPECAILKLLSNKWCVLKIMSDTVIPGIISFLLEGCRDRVYAEATVIMDREIDKWDGWSYEDVRLNPNFMGFSVMYLYELIDYKVGQSSAKIPIMLKLAKLDLQKGTTIPELMFSCCKFLPKKQALQSLFNLEQRAEKRRQLTRKIFEFSNHNGYNCFIGLLDMATLYNNQTKKLAEGILLRDIEECFWYLIDLATTYNLNLDKVFRHTTKDGVTFLHQASYFSENIMWYLLNRNVPVNPINYVFETVGYRVRSVRFLITIFPSLETHKH